MKKVFLLLLICVVLFTSCSKKAEPVVQETVVVESIPATQAGVQIVGSAPVQQAPVKPEMPKLPVEVTPEMDFLKDGYEIVTVEALADGDTTTFRLKSGVYTTRYLAIDTPETSNGLEPWGLAAKAYVNELLTNAKQIVLERDPVLDSDVPGEEKATFDKYNRLLAHVWVDGELVQYKVIEESLGSVAYLYFDYKYNDTLIKLESYVQKVDNRRVNNKNDKDPNYDYSNGLNVVELNDLTKQYLNRRVETTGIVTGVVKGNAYIQSKDGSTSVYCYGKNTQFKAFANVGNEVKIVGTYTLYNGILELSNFEAAPVKLSEGNLVHVKTGGIELVSEENMSALVRLEGVTVKEIKGNNIVVERDGRETVVHTETATGLKMSELFEVGSTYDILGNVSIYQDQYQLVLRYNTDVWNWM